MFLIPAWAALTQPRSKLMVPSRVGPGGILAWIALTLAIGYRFEVGGDWRDYIAHLYLASGRTFTEILSASDPAYVLLNWLSWHLGWGIYGVNLACGALFGLGLIA